MSQIRREVIKAFRKLHRTRQLIFAGDNHALEAGRKEINAQFKKNMQETNSDSIKKMIQLALDVDKELRTNVIQAKKKDEGVYELRITPETTRLDNIMFNPDAVIEPPRRRKGQPTGCCGGANNDPSTKKQLLLASKIIVSLALLLNLYFKQILNVT